MQMRPSLSDRQRRSGLRPVPATIENAHSAPTRNGLCRKFQYPSRASSAPRSLQQKEPVCRLPKAKRSSVFPRRLWKAIRLLSPPMPKSHRVRSLLVCGYQVCSPWQEDSAGTVSGRRGMVSEMGNAPLKLHPGFVVAGPFADLDPAYHSLSK